MSAELRLVTPGRTYENWTVIDKGVAPGERVVTDGQLRLVPGAKVEIKNEQGTKAEKENHGDAETPRKPSANSKAQATY
jgi:multidrug efflux system membrane fusion protein